MKPACLTHCLVLLLALAVMGQGHGGRGLQFLLSADRAACCPSQQHCPISYGPKTHAHSSHSPDCPHTHRQSSAGSSSALQACHPSGPQTEAALQTWRCVLTQRVGLPVPQPARGFQCARSIRRTAPALPPSTPPPRSPHFV